LNASQCDDPVDYQTLPDVLQALDVPKSDALPSLELPSIFPDNPLPQNASADFGDLIGVLTTDGQESKTLQSCLQDFETLTDNVVGLQQPESEPNIDFEKFSFEDIAGIDVSHVLAEATAQPGSSSDSAKPVKIDFDKDIFPYLYRYPAVYLL